MKKQKKKQTFINQFKSNGEIIVKICLTIFFLSLAISLFIYYEGYIYFSYNPYVYKFRNYPFQIHFIDVEDGDAILIKFPNKQTMLIDTGESIYYDSVNSYLEQYCSLEKVNAIDYLVLTHPDSDHIGNAGSIIEKYNVKTIFRPKLNCKYEEENGYANESYDLSESETYNNVISSAYRKNCKMIYSEAGINLNVAGCHIEFLSPLEEYYAESNNYSAVLMISYNSKKFLFTGDAESKIEEELISKYGEDLKADVLKVGHHGSATSTSQEFLDCVKPIYAVMSCKGSGSLPNKDVVNRLNDSKISVLSTAKLGSFEISIDNNEIVYSQAEKPNNLLALILVGIFLLNCIVWKVSIDKFKLSSLKNDI